MKKYIAKTNVSINVVLATGANRHIAFNALTGGGSVYYTDDPEIIVAMERHYKYGKLFRVDTKYVPEKQRTKPTSISKSTATAAPSAQTALVTTSTPSEGSVVPDEEDADAEESEGSGKTTIVVSDPDAAKAYLADHFGLSRTKLKSLKAIKEAAASHGIVFEGI